MSNSNLVTFTKIVPYKDHPRKNTIKKITIHHMAGNLTVRRCYDVFMSRECSTNYAIDNNLDVGLYVDEKDRAWASCSPDNDNQAVNIELANDSGAPNWHVSDKVISKCIDLVTDICKRNGIKRLNFTGDASGNLTQHCYFYATACPGPYLKTKFKYIADEVNKRLGSSAEPAKYTGEYPKLPPRGYYRKGDGYNTYTAYKNEIKKVQRYINWALDEDIDVDGEYGPITFRCVKQLQKIFNIEKDGLYGPVTRSKAMNYRR